MLTFQIEHFETIPSTNTELKKRAAAGASEGLCLIAAEQTAGRGRYDRTWVSPPGEGLYLSVLLRPNVAVEHLPLTALLGAVTVVRALHRMSEGRPALSLDIKWPNDVLLNGKKVCGILTEAGFAEGKLSYLVLGVGINLFQQTFPPGLMFPPTSLKLEAPDLPVTKEAVSHAFLAELETVYGVFVQTPQQVTKEWEQLSSYATGKTVQINTGKHIVAGITQGLRADGALLVRLPSGQVEPVTAGDVLPPEAG
ncbi:MAG: biotin--[acetyl-CoA-carboxylase] ligase [Blastocatellia bacterium]|nr:biotin--[acetyl-CoA-carboxylase] ligase [Blastocatellia bacterium]